MYSQVAMQQTVLGLLFVSVGPPLQWAVNSMAVDLADQSTKCPFGDTQLSAPVSYAESCKPVGFFATSWFGAVIDGHNLADTRPPFFVTRAGGGPRRAPNS